ncbi:hypothetical protein PNOK_0255000 [Pyrrhoderma noxium]|uniref:Uncharacterized protein n=1 Tax=Pyrrhoderma noxium TaxID=2282107 RepID=A0A286USK8_9AGAM|nr:hypothetical protein PNOK_0255000 [Pyrrhoderma noxium]
MSRAATARVAVSFRRLRVPIELVEQRVEICRDLAHALASGFYQSGRVKWVVCALLSMFLDVCRSSSRR